MKTVIHVNQHNIKHNSKCDLSERKSVLTCKTYKDNTCCNELVITDDNGKIIAKVIYRPDNPLSCGAKVWIESDTNNVRIVR